MRWRHFKTMRISDYGHNTIFCENIYCKFRCSSKHWIEWLNVLQRLISFFLPKVWLLQQKSCCEASRCGMYFPLLSCSGLLSMLPSSCNPSLTLSIWRYGWSSSLQQCASLQFRHATPPHALPQRKRGRAPSCTFCPCLPLSFLSYSAAYGSYSSPCVFKYGRQCFEDVKFNHRSQQRLMTEWICNVCSIIFHLEKIYYYLIRSPFWYKQDRVKMNVSIF